MTPTPSARQDAAQIDAALGEDCLHDPGRAKAECVACRKIVLEMVLTAARAEGRQEMERYKGALEDIVSADKTSTLIEAVFIALAALRAEGKG